MRNEPIDVCYLQVVFNKDFMDNFFQNLYGEFENRIAFHYYERVALGFATAKISRSGQNAAVAPVSMQVTGNDAWLVAASQYYGSRSVTEEHARAAVRPIEYARI